MVSVFIESQALGPHSEDSEASDHSYQFPFVVGEVRLVLALACSDLELRNLVFIMCWGKNLENDSFPLLLSQPTLSSCSLNQEISKEIGKA